MNAIVPRWEWRTFGDDFGTAGQRLAALDPDTTQDSDEIYLLSLHGNASIKVRDELMDVKRLDRLSEYGLELWTPVMKASFPISAADATAVLEALSIPAPALVRDQYTLAQLEEELVAPNPDLRTVAVHKRRRHYVVDECMVELTDMTAERHTTRTLVVESPDSELIRSTLRDLGLEGRANVNVARGLKSLVDFGARRFAVIDIGTNSVKFHLGERTADGSLHTIADRGEVTRLGEGLDKTGRLSEPAIERTVSAVDAMVDEARRDGALSIAAVGTAGLRIAANRDAVVDALRERRGIVVEVISGEEEARLAYLAATSTLPVGDGRLAVFDSGGGSSQFTFGLAGHPEERFSVEVGAAKYTDRFGLDGPVSSAVLGDALAAIADDLARLDDEASTETAIGMGGTSTNLAAIRLGLAEYDPDVVHGTRLDLTELDRQIEQFRTRDVDARRTIVGVQPNRAAVILAGACIVRTILTKLRHESFLVSDRGLRHGLFVERFGSALPPPA
jgi:exopolyphosphatase/guanosine-5'-triphosphate,3'-diphosphate pyrophosphatase